MDLQSTEVLDLDILQDATTAVTGSLIAAKAGLYINDVQPARTSAAADFTPPTYTGYAEQNVTWLAPSRSDDGKIEIVGIVPEFRPSDAAHPNDVVGVVVKDGGGNLLLASRFPDGPRPMASGLDAIVPTLRFRLSTGGELSLVS